MIYYKYYIPTFLKLSCSMLCLLFRWYFIHSNLVSNDSIGLLLQLIRLGSLVVLFDLMMVSMWGLTMDLMRWLLCLWWSNHADGISVGVGVGLIVCDLIDRHLLSLCSIFEIRRRLLLLLPLTHSFFPSSLFSMIDTLSINFMIS